MEGNNKAEGCGRDRRFEETAHPSMYIIRTIKLRMRWERHVVRAWERNSLNALIRKLVVSGL
jgi:hypothetical protein